MSLSRSNASAVKSMTLGYNNGTTSFNKEFDFRNLEELYLEYDEKHQFMKQNYKLPKLKILHYNLGWKEMPLCIETYTTIEKLQLSYFVLDSFPWMNNFKHLNELRVFNYTSKKFPDIHPENLPELKNILIASSYLDKTPKFFNNVFQFTGLEQLKLHYGWPDFRYDRLCELQNLKVLSLHGNGMKSLPTSICSLKNLEDLDLSWNFSLTALPENISELKKLRYLNLDAAYEMKELPGSLCDLEGLDTLVISDCVKLKKLPDNIGKLKQLKELDFTGCKNLKGLPASFGLLESIQTLTIQIQGKKLPENLGAMKSLKKLSLQFNGEILPASFSNLKELEELNLNECKHLNTAKNCVVLSKCRKLNTLLLCISENKFPDEWIMMSQVRNLGATILPANFKWSTANVLLLNDSLTQLCVLSDHIDLPNLFNAIGSSQIRELRLGSHIKYVPKEVGLLKNLKILDLSDNKIEEVHEYIGMLSQLEELNLSGQFTPGPPEYPGTLHLQSLPNNIRRLQNLKILHVQLNEEYIKNLKREMPNCEIIPY